MRNPAVRALEGAARRARGRTYSHRAVTVARSLQFPDGADRLVPAPVFVLSPLRSGSTLLRTVLDRHSRICAPHEMHLGSWRVETNSKAARAALDGLGLIPDDLADLLWDRVLHLQLVKARKSIIVDKTPRNALLWSRIAAHWPQARFLVLTRHPVRVADSLVAARPDIPLETHYAELEKYAVALRDAQHTVRSVLSVRYEDLTTELEETTRRITEWLNVPWEIAMLGYSQNGSAPVTSRWKKQPPPQRVRLALPAGPGLPEPSEIPDGLRKACELLGYA